MTLYNVQIKEVHRQDVLIEAENAQQAADKVADGEGIQQELHYDYTLEPDSWAVFKVK